MPSNEIASLIDNIGLPYSSINMSYSTSAPIGTMDTDVLVTLTENHHPTDEYVRELRERLPREFPGVLFYFTPADIVTQILNFGLPAPIIQVGGLNSNVSRRFATNLMNQIKTVSGTVRRVCTCIQPFDQQDSYRRRSNQSRRERIHAARCSHQRSDFAERQLSDHA